MKNRQAESKAKVLNIFRSILLFTLLITPATAIKLDMSGSRLKEALDSVKENTIIPWYDVEGWELEVCSRWGGTGLAQSGAAPGSRRATPTARRSRVPPTALVLPRRPPQ